MSKKGWIIALITFIVFSIIIVFFIRKECLRMDRPVISAYEHNQTDYLNVCKPFYDVIDP